MLGNATSRDSFSLTAGPFRSLSQPHPSHTIPYHPIPYHTRLYPLPLQAAVHLLHRRSLTLPSLTFADGSTTLASPPLVRDLEAKERAAAVSLAVPISNPDPVNPAHSVFLVESAAGGALSSVPGRCSPKTPPTPATPCQPHVHPILTPYLPHTHTIRTRYTHHTHPMMSRCCLSWRWVHMECLTPSFWRRGLPSRL